jgi:hypothetical protein
MGILNSSHKFKFFSIKSIKALKSGQFAIIRGNIENTAEKLELAKSIYSSEFYHFEFHNETYEMYGSF